MRHWTHQALLRCETSEFFSILLGPDHIRVALSLNNLAELYVNEGKYAEAEPLLKRSLTTHEKVLGPDNVHVAPILNNLAKVYWIEAKYSDAEPLLKRSLAIYEEVLGPDHPDVALSLHNLALLYTNEGKYVEAEPLYKRSLAISEKVLGPDHPDVATALSNLAELYWGEGEYVQAEPLFERSLENLSRQFDYSFTYMSERDRLQFLPIVRDNFEAYLSFCLAHVHDDSALAAKMYDLLLWEKGIVGSSLAALRARVAANGDREALKLFEEVASKRSESSHLANTLPAGWQDLKKKIDDEANELEGQLVRLVSSVREEKDIAHASWRDVQAKLQPGEAAIEFVRFHYYDGKKWTGDSEYVALVVTTQTRSAPTLVPLGLAKDLEGDPLRDYRIRLGLHEYETTRGVNVIEQRESESGAPKSSFYDAYWKPLESSLGGVTRIYLSPDGALNQVALGDITVPDGQLLMEKYDLRIVSSTKDILRTAQKHSSDVAVLVGNPMFDLDEAHERTALQALRTNQGTQSAHATGDDDAGSPIPASDRSRDLVGGKLDPLKATQKEVQEISAVLEKKHWRVETYTGENALKEAVTRVQSPRVLHLATHGFFESDQKQKLQRTPANQPSGLEDPMLRSGLFFAGANRVLSGESIPTDLDDGVLTAYEASSLNLQGTELVVLSACETGLGEVEAGEGVFGLRRAFQVAGAESILMSMWSVPDKETQELMGLFYKKWLAGEEKHEALREAQLEMRTRVEHRYGKDSPRYWGAFVLVGR